MSTDLAKTVLVICDSNFVNLCDDPDAYMVRLRNVLRKRIGDNMNLVTVSGRYGMSNVDEELPTISVQDRNKTLFIQTVENAASSFDELQIVSTVDSDPFIEGVAESMSGLQKNITRYKYNRRS